MTPRFRPIHALESLLGPSSAGQAPPESAEVDAIRVRTRFGDLWMRRDDLVMRPYIERTGVWEPEEGTLLESLLKPSMAFLDVGANVGYFSAFVAHRCPSARIDAVEPDGRNVTLLRFNLWQHAPRATVWPIALGTHRYVASTTSAENNPGNTVVDRRVVNADRLVAVAAGDEIFAGRRFDLIKIDVQGYESDVVRGLRSTLTGTRGTRLVCEFCPELIRARDEDPLAVLSLYRELGLRRFAVVSGALESPSDEELLVLCTRAGRDGFVNLVLARD